MYGAPPKLVGRERELGLIDELLDQARGGGGAVLTFSAEPGGGKTALLEAARKRAEGFRVLSCCGIEWEAELPFSGLHEMLLPLAPLMDHIPDPQREGLDRAFGREAGPSEGLNVYVGALSLVLEATRAEPVLLLVDDLQWIDQATRQALSFVARRLEEETVAVLVATRPGAALEGSRDPVEVGRLGREAVAALVELRTGRSISASATDELMRTTEGNPLALVETVRVLGGEVGRRGTILDAPPRVGTVIEQAFAGRVDGLPDDARRAAEVVAASVNEADRLIADALTHLGYSPDALAHAADLGILEHVEGRWRYTHPILRSVVHQGTGPERLRAAHAALSAVAGGDQGLSAWHAACASDTPHEPTAAALEQAGERFGLNGGALAAAKVLERAADLTPDPDRRAERLLRASLAARFGSGSLPWTVSLAQRAYESARDPAVLIKAELELAMVRSHGVDPALLTDPPLGIAHRAIGIAPDVAALGLRNAAVDAVLEGDGEACRSVLGTLDELFAAGGISPATFEVVEGRVQFVRTLMGIGDDEEIRRLASVPPPEPTDGFDKTLRGWCSTMPDIAEAVVWIEDFALGDALAEAHAVWTRRAGDIYAMLAMRLASSEQALRVGEWSRARDLARDILQLADPNLMGTAMAVARCVDAAVLGLRGAELPDLAPVEQAGRELGMSMLIEYGEVVRGLAALTAGDASAAVAHFDRAHEWKTRSGQVEPCLGTWPVDRVDALLQAGDPRATDALEELRGHAARGRRWALAAVPWFEGVLASEQAFEVHFEESLAAYPEARAPFEEARARLAYGQRLLAMRRKGDGSAQLETALATFEHLEAEPWAARARGALGIVPARPPKREPHDRDALTPQERQVAALVAGGASNKEAAGELFLSPKTIEAHLSRIYRKLGVTSRTQLAARWQQLAG